MPQPPHQPSQQLTSIIPKSVNLPDFLVTALSLLLFVTAPKHHLSPRSSLSHSCPPHHNRRFIRLTNTMSLNPNPNANPNPNFSLFPTPQSLSDWLKPRLPSDSLATWGTKPGTKNVHNLWLELADGETSLIDNTPPVRNLEVVCVRILNKDGKRLLLESHQELSDGSVRQRDRPLSEKLKSGEDIEAATIRAVKEELGSVVCRYCDEKGVGFDEVVRVVPGSYERRVEERVSLSYPGLPACYVLHTVDAFVEGLPEEEFVTEEEEAAEYGGCDQGVANEAVATKRHFWKWVPAGSV